MKTIPRFYLIFGVIGLLLNNFEVSAQMHTNQVFVISGGRFLTPDNQVRMGVWRPLENRFFYFDSMPGNYTNAALCQDGKFFGSADTFLLSYDAHSLKQLQKQVCRGIQNLALYKNDLIVAKGFGARDNFLEILDATTLQRKIAFPQIPHWCKGIFVYKDRLYVTHNQKGKVDQFPPYGVYADTLGFITVINLKNYQIEKTIPLETTGAGANGIVVTDSVIFTFNGVAKTFIKHYLTNNMTYSFSLPINSEGKILGCIQGTCYFETENENIASLNLNTNEIRIIPIQGKFAAGTLDTTSRNIYLTRTDYFSFGTLYIFSSQGSSINSFNVGISPEALAIHYEKVPQAAFRIQVKPNNEIYAENQSKGTFYTQKWTLFNKARRPINHRVQFTANTSDTTFHAQLNLNNVLQEDSLILQLVIANYGKSDTAEVKFKPSIVTNMNTELQNLMLYKPVIYPNPVPKTNPNFHIALASLIPHLPLQLEFLELNGKTIEKIELLSPLEQEDILVKLPTSLQSPGVYLLRLSSHGVSLLQAPIMVK
ncbi:MAG: hypothetical protein RML72_00405 [Bacteroidia bacterium]|nr:hypothetical protein [Bacteroidia bacterium]MDW8157327.1 hypothetical protein [Bacteroidia bacterium]